MNTLNDTLHTAWIIGTKDILDALKNKSMRSNILLMVGMVVFFYYLSVLRPFDKDVRVVLYNEGATSLELDTISLGDGAEYSFREASSLPEMEQMMSHQNLGLVVPADFDTASGVTPILKGHVFWADRMKVVELEERYSQAFSEITGQPVQVEIDQNIIIPQANADGMQSTVAYLMIYFIFTTALLLIPYLMLEEKQTRTLDALLASPASPGGVVLGKALAGFFYILVIGGLALILFSQFIHNWPLTLTAFLCYALFAVGLGLAMGSFIKAMQQIRIWTLVLILFLVIPPLFYMETNLKAGIRTILTLFPSSALASLMRYSCSTGVTATQLGSSLAISILSILVVYGLVIWRVHLSDR